MPKNEHEMTRATEEVYRELRADVAAVAGEIFGDKGGPDAVKLTRAAYLDYVRRGWVNGSVRTGPDGSSRPISPAEFRAEEFGRIVPLGPNGLPSETGLDHWEALLKEAFPAGWVPPPPPPPPSPLNALVGGGPMAPAALGPMAG
jgi:hypothetical protein